MPRLRLPAALVLAGALASVFLPPVASAQSRFLRQGEQPDQPVDRATRRRVIERLAEAVERSYVDETVARALAGTLRDQARRDAWHAVGTAQAFADTLTSVLRRGSRDLHFSVFYSHAPLPEGRGAVLPSPAIEEEERRYSRSINHGVELARRLPGNVGLLEVRELVPGAAPKLAAAMELLGDTDALILDLREARGGRPEIAHRIASHLLPPEPVLLNVTWQRETAETTRTWSLGADQLPGARYVGRDVFVLTSRRTFSAAEMLAHALQSLGRAKVVGETTGGGGHGMNFRTLDPHFAAAIPFIRPVTGGWEGTGVRPDVEAAAADALRSAHGAALRALAARAEGEPRTRLERMAADLEQGREPAEERPGGRRMVRR